MWTNCSACFSACIARRTSRVRASVWPPCNGLFKSMEVECGRKANRTRVQFSTSPLAFKRERNRKAMELRLEANQDDMDLALHALKRGQLANRIFVARDGEEALDFLFCRGPFAHRSFENPPKLVLLDLKLPKVDGMEVLKQIKEDARTKTIPIVIMTSSKEERDLVAGYNLGANSYIQKPVDFDQFRETVKTVGLYWLVINQPVPNNGAHKAVAQP